MRPRDEWPWVLGLIVLSLIGAFSVIGILLAVIAKAVS